MNVSTGLTTFALIALGYAVISRVGSRLPHLFDHASDDADGNGDGDAATKFVPVPDAAALDPLFAHSEDGPVVLFLHDGGCPISAAAYRQMTQLGGEVPLVDVRRGKDISRAIERRTGVRHESPQVIVLRHGQAVWSASHYAIPTDRVAAAARAARP